MERATAPWLASRIVAGVVSRAALGKMITHAPQFRDPDQNSGTAAPALRRRAITATGRRGACPTSTSSSDQCPSGREAVLHDGPLDGCSEANSTLIPQSDEIDGRDAAERRRGILR